MKGAKPPTTAGDGVLGLWHDLKAKEDAKKVFVLVTNEKATSKSLSNLVYLESLRELIYYVLDHRKEITTWANSERSREVRAKKLMHDQALVFAWCTANPKLAWMPYKITVEEAALSTRIQQRTTVREEISLWRKGNKKK